MDDVPASRRAALTVTHRPVDAYASRRGSAVTALRAASRRSRWLSWARLGVAIAIVVVIAASCERSTAMPWPVVAGGAAAFLALVWLHARAMAAETAARETIDACDNGMARVERAWDKLPPLRVAAPAGEGGRIVARDLGVVGDMSLMRLLDVTTPAIGGERVQQWLLADPPPSGEVAARQRSVAALGERTDFLIDMARIGRRSVGHPAGIARFIAWCSGEPVAYAGARSAAAMLLSIAILVTIGLQLSDTGSPIATRVAVPLIVLQLVIALSARRTLEKSLKGVDDVLTQLRGAEASMRRIASEPEVEGAMSAVQQSLRTGAVPALERIGRAVAWNGMRASPLAHFMANAVVGFDSHLLAAVERWRARYAKPFPEWLSHLADGEALVALATLAHDNPDWSFPRVHDDQGDWIAARSLRHPLLGPAIAIANDAHLGGPGDVVVISGSNMSGKTTYLRAVGLSALLAQAGAPVAAPEMSLRRCRARTSIRVEDDLARGVSLFLAEVMRLQAVVREAESTNGPPLLFLFDEILHGTNAADRREATRLVLQRLTAAGAAGFVTTHDPALAEGLDDRHHRHVHFEERIEHGPPAAMRFEYQMKSGPATTTNALFILRNALGEPPPA